MKIALVGYGYWGRNVARAFREAGVRVVVMDSDPHARERARSAGYETHVYGNSISEFDAAAICAPPDKHAFMIKEFLDQDCHVWTEKPIAMNAERARELISYARSKKLKLFVDHTFTFAPVMDVLRSCLDGEVDHVEIARTHLVTPRDGIDIVGDLLPHDVSILHDCSLYVRHIKVTARPLCASIEVLFNDPGVTGSVFYSWSSAMKQRRMTFYSKLQVVVYDHLNPHAPITCYGISSRAPASWTQGPITCPPVAATEPLSRAVAAFVDAVDGDDDNAEEALEVQCVVDAAYESIRTGTWAQTQILRQSVGTSET